jgi:ATP-dependent Clp protease protease subunit
MKNKLVLTVPQREARAKFGEKVVNAWEIASEYHAESGGDELILYGDIGFSWYSEGITASAVIDWLNSRKGKSVTVRINSPGGDVFEGIAIYNALVRHDGEVSVFIDALAASAASVIAMAGSKITMAENAMMMIHRAWTYTAGNAADLEREAALLRQIDSSLTATYTTRTGNSAEDIDAMLDAETWLTAAEAQGKGFCDNVIKGRTPDKAKEQAASKDLTALVTAAQKLLARVG